MWVGLVLFATCVAEERVQRVVCGCRQAGLQTKGLCMGLLWCYMSLVSCHHPGYHLGSTCSGYPEGSCAIGLTRAAFAVRQPVGPHVIGSDLVVPQE